MAAFRLIRVISIRLPTSVVWLRTALTSLYRERYPALEHAYHVQVVLEQYEGLTSEE